MFPAFGCPELGSLLNCIFPYYFMSYTQSFPYIKVADAWVEILRRRRQGSTKSSGLKFWRNCFFVKSYGTNFCGWRQAAVCRFVSLSRRRISFVGQKLFDDRAYKLGLNCKVIVQVPRDNVGLQTLGSMLLGMRRLFWFDWECALQKTSLV